MRDYIFRGKHARDDRRGWVYGSLIKAGTYCCILDPDDEDDMDYPYLDDDLGTIDGNAIPVIPDTVGQWTGLLDKNGNRIFEGDIVQRNDYRENRSNRMYVTWRNGGFELRDFNDNIDFLSNWCNEAYRNGKDVGGCYIIGNMIDNADFIKGDTE